MFAVLSATSQKLIESHCLADSIHHFNFTQQAQTGHAHNWPQPFRM